MKPGRINSGRLVQGAVAWALLLWPTTVAYGCAGVLGLDGYGSVAAALCGKLSACFGEGYFPSCREHVEARLGGAPPAERAGWLAFFADAGCASGCVNARGCLDVLPVCAPRSTTCVQTEQCCGFLTGQSSCDTRGGCCLPEGLACAEDGECCRGDCAGGVCGGIPCQPAGAPCSNDFECCTQICNPLTGVCADSICLEDGAECADGFECCSGYCAGGKDGAATGTCAPPECLPEGASCAVPEQCCQGFCVSVGDGQMVCSPGQCLPDESPCGEDGECCCGHCDPSHGKCGVEGCGPIGAECETKSDCCVGDCDPGQGQCVCVNDGKPCGDGSDCCSGKCNASFLCGPDNLCKPAGKGCVDPATCCSGVCHKQLCCEHASCDHSECQLGGPLALDCACQLCSGPQNLTACTTKVCATMPECCCFEWTDSCRQKAIELCLIKCSYDIQPPP